MEQRKILQKIKEICPSTEAVAEQVPLSAHTTFRIGGPVDFFVSPENPDQLSRLVTLCRETAYPYFIMGNGSNLLVSDAGFRGMVIHLGKEMGQVALWSDDSAAPVTPIFSKEDAGKIIFYAGAGAMLSSVSAFALRHALADMAFASGIPGTVGGALVMNAGAYDGEISDICAGSCVYEIDSDRFCFYDRLAQNFSYRHSIYQERQGLVVVGAWFALPPGKQEEIRRKTADFAERRRSKQPLELPSAGSTFKRPVGAYAAQLIDNCGLRGYRVGGAAVSEKHCGFVVNNGGASFQDVLAVMRHVRDTVERETGFVLEPEVRIIGENL